MSRSGWFRKLVGVVAWAGFGAINGLLVAAIVARWLDRPLPPTQDIGAIAGGLLGGVGRLVVVLMDRRRKE